MNHRALEFARNNDYDVFAEYIDEGESGISTDRSGLQNMIAMLMTKPHLVDAVIISDHTRLSRNRVLSINLRQKLREIGVDVISVSEPCGKQSEEMAELMGVIEEAFGLPSDHFSKRAKPASRSKRYK